MFSLVAFCPTLTSKRPIVDSPTLSIFAHHMDSEQRSPAGNLALFASGELLSKDGPVSARDALKGKYVGVYYSASWCPPCQRFTPKLVEAYSSSLKGKNFEIVFVSAGAPPFPTFTLFHPPKMPSEPLSRCFLSDRDAQAFSSYFSKMPWLAVAYDNKELKAKCVMAR